MVGLVLSCYFLSNLISTLVSVPGLIKHKIKGSTEIPFGPYLIIATLRCFSAELGIKINNACAIIN